MARVTLYLGPGGAHLSSRSLTITRMRRAGDDSAIAASYSNDAIGGTTETVSTTLPVNQMYEAVLIDTNVDGTTGLPQVLHFHTGDRVFPGAFSNFCVLSKEFVSSSSSSHSSSSWSSTSNSSSSSVSTSSESSSSQSTSSSSVSSSSQSSQSTSSSSQSSQSTSSSSSSESSSSESSSSPSSASSQSQSSVSATSESSLSSSSWST